MDHLEKYEEDIFQSYEDGEWTSAKEFDSQKKYYAKQAKNPLKKNKRINIRISDSDLIRLKAKSIESGIPYQTHIAMLIRQYVTGQFILKNQEGCFEFLLINWDLSRLQVLPFCSLLLNLTKITFGYHLFGCV